MTVSRVLGAIAILLGSIVGLWAFVIGYYERDRPALVVLGVGCLVCWGVAAKLKDRNDYHR